MAYSDIREGDGLARAAADEWLKQADAARAEALRARRAMEELQSKGKSCVEGAFICEDANKPWTAVHQNLQSPSSAAVSQVGGILKDTTRQREVISRLREREQRGQKTPSSSPTKASNAAANTQPPPNTAALPTPQTTASSAATVPKDSSGVFDSLSMQGPPDSMGLKDGPSATETAAVEAHDDPFSATALLSEPVGITDTMAPEEQIKQLQGEEEIHDAAASADPFITWEHGIAVEQESPVAVAKEEDVEPKRKAENGHADAGAAATMPAIVMPDSLEAEPEESAYEVLMRELKAKREELSVLMQQQNGTLQPSDQNKPEQNPLYQAVKPSHVKLLKGDLYSSMTPEQLEREKVALQDVIADLEQRTLEAAQSAQNSPMPSPSKATAHDY